MEENDEDDESEEQNKDREDGEIHEIETIGKSQSSSQKLDELRTRVSLPRASKTSHKYLSESQVPIMKDTAPSVLGKKKPNKKN